MMKFRVEFESMWLGSDSDGKFHKDFLDNNGSGFDFEVASDIAMELHYNTAAKNKNIKIVEMEGIR